MYLSEAEEVFQFWERHPPPYQTISIIAQMLGWKPETETAPEEGDPVDLGEIARAGIIPADHGLPASILDLDEMRERNRQRAWEIAKRNGKAG